MIKRFAVTMVDSTVRRAVVEVEIDAEEDASEEDFHDAARQEAYSLTESAEWETVSTYFGVEEVEEIP